MADGEPVKPDPKRRADGTFGPGNNANPAGRPKGPVLTTYLKAIVNRPIGDFPWAVELLRTAKLGLTEENTIGELVAEQTAKSACLFGDGDSFRQTWDRMDGKVKDTLQLEGELALRHKVLVVDEETRGILDPDAELEGTVGGGAE